MQISPSLATHAVGVSPIRPNPAHGPVSPLVLSDRLISLAQDAERAGLIDSARRCIVLAHSVLDDVGATGATS